MSSDYKMIKEDYFVVTIFASLATAFVVFLIVVLISQSQQLTESKETNIVLQDSIIKLNNKIKEDSIKYNIKKELPTINIKRNNKLRSYIPKIYQKK